MNDTTSTTDEQQSDIDFVPLRISPDKAGAMIEVKINDTFPTTTVRVDDNGYLRHHETSALIDREQGEIYTALETVTGSDATYHGAKHGWHVGDAPIIDA